MRQSPVCQRHNCYGRIYIGGEARTEALFEGVGIFGEVKVIRGLCSEFLSQEEIK
jgi:hypothetical protein